MSEPQPDPTEILNARIDAAQKRYDEALVNMKAAADALDTALAERFNPKTPVSSV